MEPGTASLPIVESLQDMSLRLVLGNQGREWSLQQNRTDSCTNAHSTDKQPTRTLAVDTDSAPRGKQFLLLLEMGSKYSAMNLGFDSIH